MISDKHAEIRIITFGTKEYEDELKLRDVVLRKPLGLSIYNDNLSKENLDCHIGAFVGNELVGTIMLTRLDKEQMKMRQVAVLEAHRYKGIASSLIRFAEDLTLKAGCSKIVLHARANVLELYQKLGYTAIGDSFIEVTIPHFEMFRLL